MSLSLFSPYSCKKLSDRFLSTADLEPTLLVASQPDKTCDLRIAIHNSYSSLLVQQTVFVLV